MAKVVNVNDLRDRWERMAPRERMLVAALGVTFVVCIVGWLAFAARDGMAAIETKNTESRKALRALAKHRAGAAEQAASGPKVEIPATAPALDSYLEGIVNEIGLKSPTYPAPKETERGEYVELSFKVEFEGVSVYELADLLERIETKSPVVVVQELTIDRNFRDKEKLDVELVVSTFRTAAPPPEEGEEEEG